MGEKNRGRFWKQRRPERGHGGFGEPGQKPGIEQKDVVLLPVQKRRMPQMDGVAVPYDVDDDTKKGESGNPVKTLRLRYEAWKKAGSPNTTPPGPSLYRGQ